MWDLEIQIRKIIRWGPKVMKIGQLQAKILTFKFWIHTYTDLDTLCMKSLPGFPNVYPN